MKKLTLAFVGLLTVASFACSEQSLAPSSPVAPGSLSDADAKPPAKPPADVPVTSTIAAALGIQSDGGGPYLHSKTLVSRIQGIGDWELDTINPKNATRRIELNFSQPIAGSGPDGTDPVALPTGEYKFRALGQCGGAFGNGLLALELNDTQLCGLRIAFDHAGVRYAIVMNPTVPSVNGPFPGTDFANVECTSASPSGACSQWEFTPSVASGNVGKLLRFTEPNGSVAQDHGNFIFSFSIVLAKP